MKIHQIFLKIKEENRFFFLGHGFRQWSGGSESEGTRMCSLCKKKKKSRDGEKPTYKLKFSIDRRFGEEYALILALWFCSFLSKFFVKVYLVV